MGDAGRPPEEAVKQLLPAGIIKASVVDMCEWNLNLVVFFHWRWKKSRLQLHRNGQLTCNDITTLPLPAPLVINFGQWSLARPVKKDSLVFEVEYMTDECEIEKLTMRASSAADAETWYSTLTDFREAARGFEEALRNGMSLDAVKALTERETAAGHDVLKVRFADEQTALHLAASYSSAEVVTWLLTEVKMDAMEVDVKGHTALHAAVLGRNAGTVAVLLSHGAQLVKDGHEMTPLEYIAGLSSLPTPPPHVTVDDMAIAQSITAATLLTTSSVHDLSISFPSFWICAKFPRAHILRRQLRAVFSCAPTAIPRECGRLRLSIFAERWPLPDTPPAPEAYAALYLSTLKNHGNSILQTGPPARESTDEAAPAPPAAPATSAADASWQSTDVSYSIPFDRSFFEFFEHQQRASDSGGWTDCGAGSSGRNRPSIGEGSRRLHLPGLFDENPMTRHCSRIIVRQVPEELATLFVERPKSFGKGRNESASVSSPSAKSPLVGSPLAGRLSRPPSRERENGQSSSTNVLGSVANRGEETPSPKQDKSPASDIGKGLSPSSDTELTEPTSAEASAMVTLVLVVHFECLESDWVYRDVLARICFESLTQAKAADVS